MTIKIQEEICHGVYKIECSNFVSYRTNLMRELVYQARWIRECGTDSMKQWQVEVPDRDPESLGSAMNDFNGIMTSIQFKQQLTEFAVSTPSWHRYWGSATASQLLHRVDIKSDFVKVPAQYRDHPWHCDPKNLVVHGILYVDDHESTHDRGTWFDPDHGVWVDPSDPDFGKGVCRVPCVSGTGWVMINTDRSWHRAVNHSDHPRYCVKFGLLLW